MSGIFGLLDPAGVDSRALALAAARASYRGRPVVRARGPVAFGAFVGEREEPQFVESEGALLVADCRIDAAIPGTPASSLAASHAGPALLEAVLAESGPEGLFGLAADFALARFNMRTGSLLLSRDAFGLRPLFWARWAGRIGFASDPEVLLALGLASGELERGPVAAYLAMGDFGGEQTAFRGVRRVLGGRWISFDLEGRVREGRWFRPEEVPEERPGPEEAAGALADALVAAVSSRARGGRTALLLSGGRDSGSVAVALARAGIAASCLTQTFDPDLDCSEEEPARQLAGAIGHGWTPLPVPSRASEADLAALPAISGTPLGFPAFLQPMAVQEAVGRADADVVLDGEGGEPLFSAAPVAWLDLARMGRLRAAASAARGYHHRWTYPYPVLAKAAVRALLPQPLLHLRERMRPTPPWVVGARSRLNPVTSPRTARGHLVLSLQAFGASPIPEMWERLFLAAGKEYACPLLDQRVVRLALSLPVELRAPVPGPKPLLARALLDGFEGSRRKVRFTSYYRRLAGALMRDFPDWFEAGSIGAQRGFVRREGLAALSDPRWQTGLLRLANLEAWLRCRAS